jgi:hypothetical protein
VTGHEIGLPPCPVCGSTDAIRIAYGYPSLEMGLAADRGEIALGGCLVGPESPDYECRNCHAPLPWVAPAPTGRSAGGGQGIGLGSQGIGHA